MARQQQLEVRLGGSSVLLSVRRLVIAGFTGRDAEAVRHHVRELEEQGIPAPASVPAFYHVDASMLTTAPAIRANAENASGEAEAVLIFPTNSVDDALVAVGSDLTDRVLERESIARAKQLPKPIGTEVWRLRDVRERWDELQLVSWTSPERRECYQQGTVAALLRPEAVIAAMPPEARANLAGLVLFLGTIPLCKAQFSFSSYFACELIDPRDGTLRCEYTVEQADERSKR